MKDQPKNDAPSNINIEGDVRDSSLTPQALANSTPEPSATPNSTTPAPKKLPTWSIVAIIFGALLAIGAIVFFLVLPKINPSMGGSSSGVDSSNETGSTAKDNIRQLNLDSEYLCYLDAKNDLYCVRKDEEGGTIRVASNVKKYYSTDNLGGYYLSNSGEFFKYSIPSSATEPTLTPFFPEKVKDFSMFGVLCLAVITDSDVLYVNSHLNSCGIPSPHSFTTDTTPEREFIHIEGQDFTYKKFAENVKDAQFTYSSIAYRTTDDQLFFSSHANHTPRKIIDNVKDYGGGETITRDIPVLTSDGKLYDYHFSPDDPDNENLEYRADNISEIFKYPTMAGLISDWLVKTTDGKWIYSSGETAEKDYPEGYGIPIFTKSKCIDSFSSDAKCDDHRIFIQNNELILWSGIGQNKWDTEINKNRYQTDPDTIKTEKLPYNASSMDRILDFILSEYGEAIK